MMASVQPLFDQAQVACESLDAGDPLRPHMDDVLSTVQIRLAGADRGGRPKMPHRSQYVGKKVAKDHPFRPAREAVYEAVDKLLNTAWAPMSGAERMKKLREDEEKREAERERDRDARAEQRAANPPTAAEKAAETEARYERAANALSNLQLKEQEQKEQEQEQEQKREQIEARLVREAREEDDLVRRQQLSAFAIYKTR